MLQMRDASFEADQGAVVPGAMRGNALIDAGDYERWLLPPEPREGIERVVHWISLGAGVIALTGGGGLVWLML